MPFANGEACHAGVTRRGARLQAIATCTPAARSGDRNRAPAPRRPPAGASVMRRPPVKGIRRLLPLTPASTRHGQSIGRKEEGCGSPPSARPTFFGHQQYPPACARELFSGSLCPAGLPEITRCLEFRKFLTRIAGGGGIIATRRNVVLRKGIRHEQYDKEVGSCCVVRADRRRCCGASRLCLSRLCRWLQGAVLLGFQRGLEGVHGDHSGLRPVLHAALPAVVPWRRPIAGHESGVARTETSWLTGGEELCLGYGRTAVH
ncbi:MAG: hypothetical protein KatS3mg005_1099 [Bryobacteraceae bacterium]|nr:MAG: hypothetical protein KatS3mg005_1099 [Bryobacteraceae bacterium]